MGDRNRGPKHKAIPKVDEPADVANSSAAVTAASAMPEPVEPSPDQATAVGDAPVAEAAETGAPASIAAASTVSDQGPPLLDRVTAVHAAKIATKIATAVRDFPPLTRAQKEHLRSQLGEDTLDASLFQADTAVPFQPLSIVLQNVRANSKVFVTIRGDQTAVWSGGDGRGLVGLSFSSTGDPALYLRNFLINAREFFVQTYNDSQEIRVQLYVRTAQPDLRGRVDLPPGAVATLQSSTDRTSVVGLSAFAIDL
ncbi:hypothetical protein [Dyella subtropica]|uniref:hypothetical protein n=1 Tax=Dyella subtropica TaxID=2992127 RepID=UPI00224EC643|nr:hypothetical protein [Dyella subtropica]